ncbi:MAG: HAD family hydrolase [Bacteroides sp.]|nr:HAD family hydrolase [Bacteroides sp.]MCM1084754.1 HAD family hydrolase [Bacteroides sp.]
MKTRYLVFDFDGTLLDTTPVILATMRATAQAMGLPEKTESECRATIGLRLRDVPAKLYPQHPGIEDKYVNVYHDIFNEQKTRYKPVMFPGVPETLHTLSEQGFPMAVASSRTRKSLVEFLDDSELAPLFAMVVGGDDVAHGKPNPDPVLALCGALGWNPQEILVVGDADVDILMGKAAGCQTCGVTYGNGTLPELQKAAPDFLIDRFGELLPIIQR